MLFTTVLVVLATLFFVAEPPELIPEPCLVPAIPAATQIRPSSPFRLRITTTTPTIPIHNPVQLKSTLRHTHPTPPVFPEMSGDKYTSCGKLEILGQASSNVAAPSSLAESHHYSTPISPDSWQVLSFLLWSFLHLLIFLFFWRLSYLCARWIWWRMSGSEATLIFNWRHPLASGSRPRSHGTALSTSNYNSSRRPRLRQFIVWTGTQGSRLLQGTVQYLRLILPALIRSLQLIAIFASSLFIQAAAFVHCLLLARLSIYRLSKPTNFPSRLLGCAFLAYAYLSVCLSVSVWYLLGVAYFVVLIPSMLFIFALAYLLWILQKFLLFIYLCYNVLVFRVLSGPPRISSRRVNLIRKQAQEARVANILGLKNIPRRRYERTLLLKTHGTSRDEQLRKSHSARTVTHSRQVSKLVLDQDDAYCFYAEPDYNTRRLTKFRGYCLREPTLEANAYTMYKRVDQKIKPVSTRMPPEASVTRTIPEDPLVSLSELPFHPPDFTPTNKLTTERLASLEINDGFLLPEEEKLFTHVMQLNERALAFEDIERGTLSDKYFSDYVIPTVPHQPWEYRNMPIPPGIMEQVLDVLKLKIDAGVYEPSESSYRSRWFCVVKKNGKLRIVHDLQPLNKVSIRDAGMLPVVDDFVEGFAARQCYTVFDLFWGFDAWRVAKESRELTAFMTPLGLLQITSLPTGYTNAPSEFQKCMVFILQEEIPDYVNIFIDDLAIKGPRSMYLDSKGKPEVLPENPGIRRFIWEHAQDVHRIMHRIALSGATFSGSKTQICRPEVLIIGQKCNSGGRAPDDAKIKKIMEWPSLKTPKEVRQFLGLAGTMRIWIANYSELV